jgi:hypothetical protein
MSQDQRTRKKAVRPSQGAPARDDEGIEVWKNIQADLRHARARDEWVGARKPTPPTKPIPKPLATYRLGLLSNSLWMWHEVFFEAPENRSTWDGVPLSVDQLREGRLVLSDEIHPDVCAALDRVLDDLDDTALTLLKAWQKTGAYQGVKFGTRRAPGVEQWSKLRLLADRALPGDHPLRPWFDYGAAAGAYQLALWDHKPDPGPIDDLEQLPDIRPLVKRAGGLPDAQVRQIPLLHSLVETALTLMTAGQAAFLRQFIKRNRGAWGFSVERVDNHTVNRVQFILDAHVQYGLEHLEPNPLLSVATTPVSGICITAYRADPDQPSMSFSLGWVVDSTVETAAHALDGQAPDGLEGLVSTVSSTIHTEPNSGSHAISYGPVFEIACSGHASTVGGDRPRWDNSQNPGKLWLGDVLLREVFPQARNIISILDAFE